MHGRNEAQNSGLEIDSSKVLVNCNNFDNQQKMVSIPYKNWVHISDF